MIVNNVAEAVCLSNLGGARLLRRRQSHRCHVCVWGRRLALHSMCGQCLGPLRFVIVSVVGCVRIGQGVFACQTVAKAVCS